MDIKGIKVKKKSSIPLPEILHMMPALHRMSFYSNQTIKEYAGRFKSPLLRLLLENIIGPDYCVSGMIFTLATLTSGDSAYPVGESLGMAEYLKKTGRYDSIWQTG